MRFIVGRPSQTGRGGGGVLIYFAVGYWVRFGHGAMAKRIG